MNLKLKQQQQNKKKWGPEILEGSVYPLKQELCLRFSVDLLKGKQTYEEKWDKHLIPLNFPCLRKSDRFRIGHPLWEKPAPWRHSGVLRIPVECIEIGLKEQRTEHRLANNLSNAAWAHSKKLSWENASDRPIPTSYEIKWGSIFRLCYYSCSNNNNKKDLCGVSSLVCSTL